MRELKDIFKCMPILSSLYVICILTITLFTIDLIFLNTESFNASVIDKNYKPEKNSIGTGYGMTGNGKTGLIVTSQHESEKFLLIVKTENGQILSAECEPKLYYNKQIGDKIKCKTYNGYFTGTTYNIKAY